MSAAGGGEELLLEVLDVAAVGADAPLQRIHPMILHPNARNSSAERTKRRYRGRGAYDCGESVGESVFHGRVDLVHMLPLRLRGTERAELRGKGKQMRVVEVLAS